MENTTMPRRSHMGQWTPAEQAIYNAMQEVRKAGSDPMLNDAINLLSWAKDKVADYVDRGYASTN